ncbi:MAG: hypothetical protein ACOH2E_02875 [Candidatus Paracaedibacter sp.]
MKVFLFKNTIKFIVIFSYIAVLSVSFAMDQLESEEQRIRSYFQEDAIVIQQALEPVSQAELHFFWTTGRELDDLKSEYGANFQVNIGGAKYGEKFPLYVELLLENSPAHLTVKFVCDEMTRNSNRNWIITLQKRYFNRFQVLDSRDVIENILKALPDQKELLLTLFQNATKGNPAISSDCYRIVGLLYGSNSAPENVQDTQYIYCDVDTFCFGMSQPNQMIEGRGHTDLVKALFVKLCPPIEMPVYIGRRDDGHAEGRPAGNSLLKFRIRDLEQYKSFCYHFLETISSSEVLQKTSSEELNLLNYFSTLHDYVSKGSQAPEAVFATYLEKFSLSLIDTSDIIHVTGPGLLSRLKGVCFPLEQQYPDTMTMEWHPTYYLGMGYSGPSLDNVGLELSSSVLAQFKQYARKLSNVSYVLRFGTNHPFVMKLMDHLRADFPYAAQGFKVLMKQLYNEQVKSQEGLVVENWLDEKVSNLTQDYYYDVLQEVLSQLGLDRPLIRDDIDFRI